ncbi:hypothetical protein K9L97_02325 [Candidatus Woesearchaeota archaeon]|nr:hypothetical protein [Candidatus Woesearchaeota archaeon]
MPFSKTFPKSTDKSVYPKWEEIYLTEEEEKKAEQDCRNDNILKMLQCVDDARSIVLDKKLMESQQILVDIAVALFEKRASHEVFFKEKKAKEKFDKLSN